VLLLAHSLPIALRRRFPVQVLGCGLATGLAFAALRLNLVPLGLGILIYVYSLAALRPRRMSLAGLAATVAMMAGRWLPEGAASALTGASAATLPMWVGGLLFAAYGLALALIGTRLVVRGDLT
jgi:hypothetical protein